MQPDNTLTSINKPTTGIVLVLYWLEKLRPYAHTGVKRNDDDDDDDWLENGIYLNHGVNQECKA